jgi:outer membrane biosynthesis protein TonB
MTPLNEQQESELANIQSILDDESNTGTDTPQVVNLEAPVDGEIPVVDEKAKKEAEKKEKAEKAKAEKEQKAAEKKAEKEAKKAEAEAKKEAKIAQANEPRLEQNGIKMPSTGTTCRQIWDLCNSLSTAKGGCISKSELFEGSKELEINPFTLATQHYRWSKFYNVKPSA